MSLLESQYDRGWREGARYALDSAAETADRLGRPLTADELRKVGAEFDMAARRASGGAA